MHDDFHDRLIECLPHLRAFAIMITRDRERAEDLVQDTVVRALSKSHLFAAGTNFKAWLFTILRNQHIDGIRLRRREAIVSMPEDLLQDLQITIPNQESRLVLKELMRAVGDLSHDQQEVLLLVVGQGMSYEQAAQVCACPIGTIRSRLARARQELQRALNGPEPVAAAVAAPMEELEVAAPRWPAIVARRAERRVEAVRR